jgi:hypothetical protein
MLALPLVGLGCGRGSERAPAIGEAYVGPFELNLIAELAPEAPVVTTLQHGERVEVLEYRRRFARVRCAEGVEGWADGLLLLTAANMARLRRLSMNAARLPSQGKVTVFDALNVHTDPHREAPSFYQLQEGNLAEVVAHQLGSRGPYQPPEGEEIVTPLNSYDLPPERPPDGPRDDWSLVRMSDGRAGWALTRMLMMVIPDEVAQYAGGHRITSYASLGSVIDQGRVKHHWLWTTLSRGGQPYQFDSFRVFVWSRSRHRYETVYIERNLVGYYPIVVDAPEEPTAGDTRILPQFRVIVRSTGGGLERRTYAFEGYRARLRERIPWEAPARRRGTVETEHEQQPAPGEASLWRRLWNRLRGE